LRSLSEADKKELEPFSRLHKFKGVGQRDSLVLNFLGLTKLIMKLPGTNAKLTRTQFATIIKRYFARDPTLIQEFEEAEPSAIHAVASEAMHDQPVQEDTSEPAEGEVVKKVQGELAQIQGQYAELAKRMEQMEQTRIQDEATLVRLIKKKDNSERGKQLRDQNKAAKRKKEDDERAAKIKKEDDERAAKIKKEDDERAARIKQADDERTCKLKIEESKNEAAMHVLKNTSDIEKEQAIASKIDKEIELLKLKKQMEDNMKNSTATSSPRYFTVPAVASMYGLYEGLSMRYQIRITNQVINKLTKPPNNICAKGICEDRLTGKNQPHFGNNVVGLMKKIIEDCKKEQLEIPIGDISQED